MSRFMQNWTQSSCLFGSRFACAQVVIFFAKPNSINAGEASIVFWVAACIHHSAIHTTIERHFGGFFLSNNSAPANRILCNPWSEQAGVWVKFCMKRLRTLKLFQIFSTEIKKSKTHSGWCPFKGLSNGTTLIQIQSGRTVPLNLIRAFYNFDNTKCLHTSL